MKFILIELFGHAIPISDMLYSMGCFTTILGFCVTNIVYLRVMIIAANIPIAISGVLFSSHANIGWAVLYVLINSFMLTLLFIERIQFRSLSNLKSLYSICKFSMTPREFLKIVQMSTPISISSGEYFIREGESSRGLFLVDQGAFEIILGDSVVGSISHGCFLGELSSLYSYKATADVRCKNDATGYLLLSQSIYDIKKSNHELYEKLFISASRAICNNLQVMDSLASG